MVLAGKVIDMKQLLWLILRLVAGPTNLSGGIRAVVAALAESARCWQFC